MIIGTGIDIIEVERVEEKLRKNDDFRSMVFSAREISYCESKPHKAEHYAARFAAKEAFLKAMGSGLTAGYTLREIEITGDDLGKPSIELRGDFLTLAAKKKATKIHLSISHVRAMACAVVILEQ